MHERISFVCSWQKNVNQLNTHTYTRAINDKTSDLRRVPRPIPICSHPTNNVSRSICGISMLYQSYTVISNLVSVSLDEADRTSHISKRNVLREHSSNLACRTMVIG